MDQRADGGSATSTMEGRDVDRVAVALEHVVAGVVRGAYVRRGDGSWAPRGDREPLPVATTEAVHG